MAQRIPVGQHHTLGEHGAGQRPHAALPGRDQGLGLVGQPGPVDPGQVVVPAIPGQHHVGTVLAGQHGADVVLPWDGRDHYLAGIYRTGLADQAEALIAAGERSMRALTGTVLTQRVVLPDGDPLRHALTNLNAPADLR